MAYLVRDPKEMAAVSGNYTVYNNRHIKPLPHRDSRFKARKE